MSAFVKTVSLWHKEESKRGFQVFYFMGFFGEEVQSLYQLLKGLEVQGEALMQL